MKRRKLIHSTPKMIKLVIIKIIKEEEIQKFSIWSSLILKDSICLIREIKKMQVNIRRKKKSKTNRIENT